MEKSREKSHRKEQYESLKKDTDQLLALATELKTNVDKTTEIARMEKLLVSITLGMDTQ